MLFFENIVIYLKLGLVVMIAFLMGLSGLVKLLVVILKGDVSLLQLVEGGLSVVQMLGQVLDLYFE
jgi:hypothetical protein